MSNNDTQTETATGQVEEFHYFATPVYIIKKPEFLDVVRKASLDSLSAQHGKNKPDKIYPMRMSGSLLDDLRIAEFAQFVINTGWEILSTQGFAMEGMRTTFTEMWCQEHYQTSSMEYHAHPGGNFIVGFYFLDTPEHCPHAVIHDPRPARVMIDIPQRDPSQATLASTMINFKPEPGMLMFAPAWLPHSFGRNPSKDPFRFVHFNISVMQNDPVFIPSAAEVV